MAAKIPLFDGTNYTFWKVKMRTLFLSMGLWETVENGCDDESDSERQKRDAEALSQIQQGVSDWIFLGIMKATKAKEAWDILQTKYERDGRFLFLFLQKTGSIFESADFSKWKETISIVATLIATVTFTAGITMPGGYIVDSKDPNQGMAILTRKAAFMAFVITDTIALTLSVLAVLTQLYNIADNPIVINKQIALAFVLTFWALIAMLLAFITGTYAVLAPSSLSISVCVIPPILLCFCLVYYVCFLPRVKTEDI
ncbi:hypothetical protein CsSME_00020761 [Camellia sinensis var. sinensis]